MRVYAGLRLVYPMVLSDLGEDQLQGFACGGWHSIDAVKTGSISTWWRTSGTAIEETTSKYELYYDA